MIKKICVFIIFISSVWVTDFLTADERLLAQEIQEYIEKREHALVANKNRSFESLITLSPKEQKVSEYLNKLKKELLFSYIQTNDIPSSHNFLSEKKRIEKTELYSFIKKMPKGALLHVHSASLLTSEWLIQELTRIPDCYVYWLEEGPLLKGTLHFYEKDAVPNGFLSVAELRSQLPDFDETLLFLLQIEKRERTSSNLWEKFEGWFTKTKGLIHYKPAFIKYYKGSIESLIEDNLQYMELRSLNSTVYNLDGTAEDSKEVINAFLQVRNEIREKHPYFDFKIIHTEFRNIPKNRSAIQIELAYLLRSLYPDFVIGYDLVGEEDSGRTTLDHIETLMRSKFLEKKYGIDLPYYFHNGESNWASNTNLYDAVLLNCKRIGHGLNLFHYPYLIEKIKEEDICIEVCPISNQVLGYVSDLRIHPAAGYLKAGVPCVISSDDPGLFGYHGMSPDLWQVIMAWDLDFKALKQLCINSLKYSGMTEEEKCVAFQFWNEKWNAFIDEFSEM